MQTHCVGWNRYERLVASEIGVHVGIIHSLGFLLSQLLLRGKGNGGKGEEHLHFFRYYIYPGTTFHPSIIEHWILLCIHSTAHTTSPKRPMIYKLRRPHGLSHPWPEIYLDITR
jgi:hypothetical protein